MNETNITGLLESFEDPTPQVRRLFIRVEKPLPFRFRPGQYVSVRIPGSGMPIFRPYSIASAPNPEERFELCFKHLEGGIASQYLYSRTAGQILEMNGPSGDFALSDRDASRALFIATGTGISPIRSMLQYLFQGGFGGSARLLFGVRQESDILYRGEFERLQRKHAGFRFLPTLSRPDAAWKGLAGHVQDHLPALLQTGPDLEIYICGHQSMVRELHVLLSRHGLHEEQIHHEKYIVA